jgi:hypothetical protein
LYSIPNDPWRSELNHTLWFRFNLPNEDEGAGIAIVDAAAEGKAVDIVVDKPPVLDGYMLSGI